MWGCGGVGVWVCVCVCVGGGGGVGVWVWVCMSVCVCVCVCVCLCVCVGVGGGRMWGCGHVWACVWAHVRVWDNKSAYPLAHLVADVDSGADGKAQQAPLPRARQHRNTLHHHGLAVLLAGHGLGLEGDEACREQCAQRTSTATKGRQR